MKKNFEGKPHWFIIILIEFERENEERNHIPTEGDGPDFFTKVLEYFKELNQMELPKLD